MKTKLIVRARARGMPVRRQQGIVLFTTLIALVVITLAAVALVRSVDTGVLISGNLAFRKGTTLAGDSGTEAALTWLSAQGTASLQAPNVAKGYYANWMENCDITGNATPTDPTDDINWDGSNTGNSNCNMSAVSVPVSMMPDGYTATYVINRMCDADGNPNVVNCESYTPPGGSSAVSGSSAGGVDYSNRALSGTPMYYYRVTTRVAGPRNTSSYVQTVLVF